MAVTFYAIWNGNALVPEMYADRGEASTLPVGKRLKVTATRTRSPAHHRALFGALEEIRLHQWPVTHPYQPGGKEEFRAWLTVKAKHRTTTFVEIEGERDLEVLKTAYRAERAIGNFVWLMKIDGQIAVVRPASIDWGNLDQDEFAPVFSAIADVVMQEANISIDDVITYLKSKQQAA